MARVFDNDSDVLAFGKGEAGSNICRTRDVDGIIDIVSQSTRLCLRRERITARVLEQGCLNRGRRIEACACCKQSMIWWAFRTLTGSAEAPKPPEEPYRH